MKAITFGGNVIATLFKMFCGLILAAVALLDVSCATYMRGTTDTLVVESYPMGAAVRLSNGMVGKTPASFEVPRYEDLIVRIGKDGYEPFEVYMKPINHAWSSLYSDPPIPGDLYFALFMDILIPPFPAIWAIYDLTSGALYELNPNPIRVRLYPATPGSPPIPIDGLVKGSGTGFFITDDGYFLTNYHVVENAAFVEVVTGQGKKRARVVRIDPVNDLAVLKIEGQFTSLPLVTSENVELGDPVFTVGFPVGSLLGVLPKLTKGSINSLAGIEDDARQFQISVPIQPGNSGGPLVDEAGNVTGIVVSSLKVNEVYKKTGAVPQLVNYAVKSAYILAFLEALQGVDGKLQEPSPAEQSEDRSASQKRVLEATFRVLVNKHPPSPAP